MVNLLQWVLLTLNIIVVTGNEGVKKIDLTIDDTLFNVLKRIINTTKEDKVDNKRDKLIKDVGKLFANGTKLIYGKENERPTRRLLSWLNSLMNIKGEKVEKVINKKEKTVLREILENINSNLKYDHIEVVGSPGIVSIQSRDPYYRNFRIFTNITGKLNGNVYKNGVKWGRDENNQWTTEKNGLRAYNYTSRSATDDVIHRSRAFLMAENGAVEYNDLENWMAKLPEELKNVPIIYLAIPGSHDSMTYGITRNSGLAPDAEPILKNLYGLFQGTILRWTITQDIDALQQLLIGIRYFDLRLATKTGTNSIFFTHGVYAGEITGPLRQIKEFIDSHPEEVVILDFQHFYGFTNDDHLNLIKFIIDMYGPRLVPKQPDLTGITLNTLNRLRRQVIVVYRHQSVYSTSEFWLPQMMPSPWPQQENISGLYSFLLNVKRPQNMGFVHQVVLTPTPGFILFRWTSTLKDKCAKPVKKELYAKLLDFSPGRPMNLSAPAPVNVVIADFVDLDDAIFPKTIIQLNNKLLRSREIPNSYG